MKETKGTSGGYLPGPDEPIEALEQVGEFTYPPNFFSSTEMKDIKARAKELLNLGLQGGLNYAMRVAKQELFRKRMKKV